MNNFPAHLFTSNRLFDTYKRLGLKKTVFFFSMIAFFSVTLLIVPINMLMGGSILTGMVINLVVCTTFMPYHLYQVLSLMVLDKLRGDMYEKSIRDELTKVYNRRYFFEASQLLENGSALIPENTSLLMIDIDDFKVLNDTHGHHIGDLALTKLTENISSMLRSTDVLARYGGDEFICLLPQTKRDQALEIAKRVINRIEGIKLKENNHDIPLHISIGVTTSEHEVKIEELIALADEALYKAKQSGKNQIKSI
jgi:diguanylate cyclase (GGDEF)-like protein